MTPVNTRGPYRVTRPPLRIVDKLLFVSFPVRRFDVVEQESADRVTSKMIRLVIFQPCSLGHRLFPDSMRASMLRFQQYLSTRSISRMRQRTRYQTLSRTVTLVIRKYR